MIRASVSNLDKYASYLGDDDFPLEVLLADLRGQTPRTPAMERGHAFAKAMENAGNPQIEAVTGLPVPFAGVQLHGEDRSIIIAEGHAFAFTCDAEIEAWPRRELKAEKDYGGIIVSARCDRLHGTVIADDKSTSHFSGDAGVEKYIDKYQWRYYLDIFVAHEFRWHIWETREIPKIRCECPPYYAKEDRHLADFCPLHGEPQYRKAGTGVEHGWEVFAHHVVRNYRYPAMEEECRELAQQYRQFAEQNGL